MNIIPNDAIAAFCIDIIPYGGHHAAHAQHLARHRRTSRFEGSPVRHSSAAPDLTHGACARTRMPPRKFSRLPHAKPGSVQRLRQATLAHTSMSCHNPWMTVPPRSKPPSSQRVWRPSRSPIARGDSPGAGPDRRSSTSVSKLLRLGRPLRLASRSTRSAPLHRHRHPARTSLPTSASAFQIHTYHSRRFYLLIQFAAAHCMQRAGGRKLLSTAHPRDAPTLRLPGPRSEDLKLEVRQDACQCAHR